MRRTVPIPLSYSDGLASRQGRQTDVIAIPRWVCDSSTSPSRVDGMAAVTAMRCHDGRSASRRHIVCRVAPCGDYWSRKWRSITTGNVAAGAVLLGVVVSNKHCCVQHRASTGRGETSGMVGQDRTKRALDRAGWDGTRRQRLQEAGQQVGSTVDRGYRVWVACGQDWPQAGLAANKAQQGRPLLVPVRPQHGWPWRG